MMMRKGPRPDRSARRKLGCEVVELDDLSVTCDRNQSQECVNNTNGRWLFEEDGVSRLVSRPHSNAVMIC